MSAGVAASRGGLEKDAHHEAELHRESFHPSDGGYARSLTPSQFEGDHCP